MDQEIKYPEDDASHETTLSYQEKSLIVSLFTSVVVYAVYGWQVAQRYQAGNYDAAGAFRFWGIAILLLILVLVVIEVIMQVIFNVINTVVTREEVDPSFSDERDTLIDMKATNYQFMVFGIGFLLAMVAIALGRPPVVMFALIMGFMMAAGIFGSIVKLYLYRRGF